MENLFFFLNKMASGTRALAKFDSFDVARGVSFPKINLRGIYWEEFLKFL
jgi:hypothetical protein